MLQAIRDLEEELSDFGYWQYIGDGRFQNLEDKVIAAYDQITPTPRPRKPRVKRQDTKDVAYARTLLKPWGFEDLEGEEGQVELAELIRLEKMELLADETKIFFASISILPVTQSSFWITHRNKNPLEFTSLERKLLALNSDLEDLMEAGLPRQEAKRQIRDMVAKLGFLPPTPSPQNPKRGRT